MRVTNVEELESDERKSVKNWKNFEAFFFSCREFLGTVSIREYAVFVTASTCFSPVWKWVFVVAPLFLPFESVINWVAQGSCCFPDHGISYWFSRPSHDMLRIQCVRSLSCSKTGNKTRASCFATLLQNEFNSDVECFINHVRTCLATNKVARFFSWVVKRTTPLFNSIQQVARFLMLVLPRL